MKRFKTKRKNNNKRFYVYVSLIILFIIIFILLSTLKLNSNYQNLVAYSLNKINNKQKIGSINLEHIMNVPKFITKKKIVQNEKKGVYIYNTHDKEKYQDDTTIYDASKMLKNNLNKLGIDATIESNITSNYKNNSLNYYDISKMFLNKAISENKYQYYLDIHRDDVNDTKIEINNKEYAKILFVLGLNNSNYQKNKSILEKMNNYLNQNYPGISKGILEKKGNDVNGIYNQDLDQNVILIEIGGINNNKEEVNNSTEIIALLMYYMLGD